MITRISFVDGSVYEYEMIWPTEICSFEKPITENCPLDAYKVLYNPVTGKLRKKSSEHTLLNTRNIIAIEVIKE